MGETGGTAAFEPFHSDNDPACIGIFLQRNSAVWDAVKSGGASFDDCGDVHRNSGCGDKLCAAGRGACSGFSMWGNSGIL